MDGSTDRAGWTMARQLRLPIELVIVEWNPPADAPTLLNEWLATHGCLRSVATGMPQMVGWSFTFTLLRLKAHVSHRRPKNL